MEHEQPSDKLALVDRRLLDNGPAPEWRETLNEMLDTSMQASRDLDYKEYEPRAAARRPQ